MSLDDTATGAGARPKGPLGRRMALGSALVLGGNMVQRLIGFVSLAILARLLGPEDFGLVALAMAVIGFIDATVNRQFHYALIRTADPTKAHFDTAFTLHAIWGLFAVGCLLLSAGPVANFYETPALEPVLRVLALRCLVGSLANPYFAVFEKKLDFLPNFALMTLPRLTYFIVVIPLAFLYQSYWALIIGQVALRVAYVVITYAFMPRRLGVSFAKTKEILGFGLWLSLSGMASFATKRIDQVMIGAALGAGVVGIYYIGYEIATLLTQQMAFVLSKTGFAGLAALSDDLQRMRRGYYRMQEAILAAMLPLGVGIALTAPELLTLFVGSRWLGAAPVLQYLAPVIALSTLSSTIQAAVMVEGKTRRLFYRNVVVLIVQVPLLYYGLERYGLEGAIGVRCLMTLLLLWLSLGMARELTGDHRLLVLLKGWRSLLACAVMAAVVLPISPLVTGPGFEEAAIGMAVKAVIGAGVYAGVHLLAWRLAGSPDGVEETLLSGLQRAAKRWPLRAR